jgi:hypothetical protein
MTRFIYLIVELTYLKFQHPYNPTPVYKFKRYLLYEYGSKFVKKYSKSIFNRKPSDTVCTFIF